MSKELVGQIPPEGPGPEFSGDPTKVFITDISGKPGPAGQVDPEVVEGMVEDYLLENPVGLYVETFVQSTPAEVWVITHSLPFQPAVSIVDSAGTRIETEIVYDSPTQVRSIASAGFSGTAYLS